MLVRIAYIFFNHERRILKKKISEYILYSNIFPKHINKFLSESYNYFHKIYKLHTYCIFSTVLSTNLKYFKRIKLNSINHVEIHE